MPDAVVKQDGNTANPRMWYRCLWAAPVFCVLPFFFFRHAVGRLAAAFLINSFLTFILYCLDKRAAEKSASRIPEAVLHGWEFFCGWPGALLAQCLIHHKNRKISYKFLFLLIIAANLGVLYLIWRCVC